MMHKSILLLLLFFMFSFEVNAKVFKKEKCDQILKNYDVSFKSWNNILKRYLSERKKIEDKKEINKIQNVFGNAMRVHEIRMNAFSNSFQAFCK